MPPPTASPTAATAQMLAAVVSPLTTYLPAKDDRASPYEAYAAGYLHGDAKGIEDDVLLVEDVGEAEDGDHHEQGRPQRDEGVGPHPCGPLQPFAL